MCSVTCGITGGTGSGTLITSYKWNEIERTAAILRPRVSENLIQSLITISMILEQLTLGSASLSVVHRVESSRIFDFHNSNSMHRKADHTI